MQPFKSRPYGDILSSRATAAYGVRGATAVARVIEILDGVLSEPFFRQVRQLHELPTSNQVLLKREGYRQIFSTFALIESSLDLSLELDDAVHPSQRNIAALYEYWTFLKLVEVLGHACDDSRAALRLFERDGDGLSLGLKRGRQSKLQWRVDIAGDAWPSASTSIARSAPPTNSIVRARGRRRWFPMPLY